MTKYSDVNQRGVIASRPSAGSVIVGAVYYSTDEGKYYRSNGSSWDEEPSSGVTNYMEFAEVSAPSSPASGYLRVYAKTDHNLYQKSSGGTESNLASGGGGSTGINTYNNAWASPPSAPASGDLWYPSDAPYWARYNGSSWDYYINNFKCTLPVDSNYAWVNQGSATVDTSHGGIYLTAPSSTLNLRIRKMAAPATPYTVTALFALSLRAQNYQKAGLCFRESSTGKLATNHIVHNGSSNGLVYQPFTFASPTSLNASYLIEWMPQNAGIYTWLQIQDNGTNRICNASVDGTHFFQTHSISRTDYLTGGANEIGFFADTENASASCGAWLLSWAIT